MAGETAKKILMGEENPNGYRLEEALHLIRHELHLKTQNLLSNESAAAKSIVRNNLQIINLLGVCADTQTNTLDILNELSPEEAVALSDAASVPDGTVA